MPSISVEVARAVDTLIVLVRRGLSMYVRREAVVQHAKSTGVLGALCVLAAMELGERRVADHVHVSASS